MFVCLCVFAGEQQALAAHTCNSTLKHMINKIRRDSQVFERSVNVFFTYLLTYLLTLNTLYFTLYLLNFVGSVYVCNFLNYFIWNGDSAVKKKPGTWYSAT